jgi:tetratricopeptide (TPR) repeat protein
MALVYERLGMWDQAAGEYEVALKNPPRKWFLGNPAFWALDQFRLAKVSEWANRPEKAKEWYERFLTDWKEADPGIPEVEEARKRLVALGGSPPPAS